MGLHPDASPPDQLVRSLASSIGKSRDFRIVIDVDNEPLFISDSLFDMKEKRADDCSFLCILPKYPKISFFLNTKVFSWTLQYFNWQTATKKNNKINKHSKIIICFFFVYVATSFQPAFNGSTKTTKNKAKNKKKHLNFPIPKNKKKTPEFP